MGMILECARSGITKTKIMYKAYLSHAQVKEYIALLQDNELLSYEEGTQLYRLSEKGYKFLQSYGEISELISPMPNTTLNF